MPSDKWESYDESTSASGPYFLEGAIHRMSDKCLYKVGRTEKVRDTSRRAWLIYLDAPTDEQVDAATEWRWDSDQGSFVWRKVRW